MQGLTGPGLISPLLLSTSEGTCAPRRSQSRYRQGLSPPRPCISRRSPGIPAVCLPPRSSRISSIIRCRGTWPEPEMQEAIPAADKEALVLPQEGVTMPAAETRAAIKSPSGHVRISKGTAEIFSSPFADLIHPRIYLFQFLQFRFPSRPPRTKGLCVTAHVFRSHPEASRAARTHYPI